MHIICNPEADSEILDSSIGLYIFFLLFFFSFVVVLLFPEGQGNQAHSLGHLRGSLAQGWNAEPHTDNVSSVCVCCSDVLQATVWMNGQSFSESSAGFHVADVLVLGKKILIYQSKIRNDLIES